MVDVAKNTSKALLEWTVLQTVPCCFRVFTLWSKM